MLEKAIIFATNAHCGQVRKGTPVPYILHPMEVATIVAGLAADEELITAALLHDTIEDCKDVTPELIREEFGSRVTSLVMAESEDKTKTWMERKGATIEHINHETRIDVKMLTLADKLANMRSLERDYMTMGDDIFLCFNQKDPAKIAWYYKGVLKGLGDLEETLAYQEYERLIERVFG